MVNFLFVPPPQGASRVFTGPFSSFPPQGSISGGTPGFTIGNELVTGGGNILITGTANAILVKVET